MDDLISRQAAIDATIEAADEWDGGYDNMRADMITDAIRALPSARPEIVKCKDCKFFELDHFEKVDGFPIPIIVAHEICMKWGDGCKSRVDGWCFMAERRTDE